MFIRWLWAAFINLPSWNQSTSNGTFGSALTLHCILATCPKITFVSTGGYANKWMNIYSICRYMGIKILMCYLNMKKDNDSTWIICVRTRTLNQAVPRTLPASLDLTHVYFPRSVERTFAINKLPSSRIWILPEKLSCPSVKKKYDYV